jgi:Ca-activated chloride channel family protein
MRRGLAAILCLALAGWTPFRSLDPDVEAGNQAFAIGRYDDALAAYDRAARRGVVDADSLAFDRGTALLKKADAATDPDDKRRLTERALDDLKRAGHAVDPRIRGAASYNRGNALLGRDKLDEAIEAYKQALRDDAGLDDARLNLELALRRRHDQAKRSQSSDPGGQGQQGQGGPPKNQSPGQQGSGSGSNSQSGSGGDGSNQPPGNGSQGSDAQRSGGQGSSDPGSSGQGTSRAPDPKGPPGQNGQNDQSGSNDPSSRAPQPKGKSSRSRSAQHGPKTPAEGKLDDLDDYSRRLQKEAARRHATGHAADPQHDW